MLDTVTSKISSRQFYPNLTSIGGFDVIIQIIGEGGQGLGMLFFLRQLYPNWRKLGEIDVTSLLNGPNEKIDVNSHLIDT